MHIAVKVVLNKPLVSQFLLDGKVQKIEYKSLPSVRFECGKYRYILSECLEKKKVNEQLVNFVEAMPTGVRKT